MADASTRPDLDALRDRAEYLTMHPTGPGWMQAPFDVLALAAEVERLRDGIRQHRETIERCPDALTSYDAERALWALLDDRTETT